MRGRVLNSIGTRLMAGYLLLAALAMGIGWFGYLQTNRINTLLVDETIALTEARSLSTKMRIVCMQVLLHIKDDLVSSSDEEDRVRLSIRVNESSASLEELADRMDKHLESTTLHEGRAQWPQITPTLKEFLHLVRAVESARNDHAMSHYSMRSTLATFATRQQRLLDQLMAFEDQQTNLMHVVRNRAVAMENQVRMIALTLSLLALLGGLALVSVGSLAITRPVKALVNMARQISSNDVGSQVPVNGPEEIIALAQALNAMIARLRSSIVNLEHNVETISTAQEELSTHRDQLEVLVAKRTAELSRINDKFTKLFNFAAVPLCFVDKSGLILDINHRFQSIFGYNLQDIPTLNHWFLLAFPDRHYRDWARSAWDATVRAAAENDTAMEPMEYQITCKGGEERTLVISGTTIDDNFLAACFDVSERKQFENQLLIARDAAEAANRAKSVFLANMSHELRTPMNAILGYSQLLKQDASLQPEQRKYIATINRSGEYLLALINDILEISRIKNGRIIMEPVTFDLHALLGDLHTLFALRTNAKRLRFDLKKSSALPRYVVTEEHKLRQVLINLLDNAVKFTEQGGVSMSVDVLMDAARQARLVVEVSDTGVGIAPEEIDKVFTYFEQTASGLRSGTGTGLSMAISRDYARRMGGDLTVTSQWGKGSTFHLEINIREGSEADFLVQPVDQRIIGLAPGQAIPRILVVEDREENRTLLVRMLRTAGFEVKGAVNGEEAVEAFASFRPNFIWMDVGMVMDGMEATRRIKATEAGRSTPIVALTASALAEEEQPLLDAGCDALIRKPFREHEIFQVMAKHLKLTYNYASDRVPAEEHQTTAMLTDQQVAQLPADLRQELQQAVLMLDTQQTLALIATIADPSLRAALQTLAENLEYPRLLALLEADLPPVMSQTQG